MITDTVKDPSDTEFPRQKPKQPPIEEPQKPGGSGPEYLPRPEDVFFINIHLPGTGEFYGREKARSTIEGNIKRLASTSIVGPRRIGKTWLLDYARLSIQEKGDEHIRAGYIDTTIPGFSIARFTIMAMNALGDRPYEGTSTANLTTLYDMVVEMKARKQIPVLCIDEFEGFGEVAEFDTNFFTQLRAIAQAGLVLITASKTPLIDIVGEIGDSGKTSGFFNIFEQLTLAPFDERDAQHFADEKSQQAGFTDEERQRLLHFGKKDGQWHPLRMQLTGKMLLRDKRLSNSSEPRDWDYWQQFEQELETTFKGVVRV